MEALVTQIRGPRPQWPGLGTRKILHRQNKPNRIHVGAAIVWSPFWSQCAAILSVPGTTV